MIVAIKPIDSTIKRVKNVACSPVMKAPDISGVILSRLEPKSLI